VAWMSVVIFVCCQVEVSATSGPLVRRSPTDCGASLCVIQKPHLWGAKNINQLWLMNDISSLKGTSSR
jgi:hypothetical protein